MIGGYALGGRGEAGLAVEAALRAFRETDWREDRRLLATEVGKVLPDARFETSTAPLSLRFLPTSTRSSSPSGGQPDYDMADRYGATPGGG